MSGYEIKVTNIPELNFLDVAWECSLQDGQMFGAIHRYNVMSASQVALVESE
jgi:hypothetical protein